MALDLFRQILFNDGEELTFDDLNNSQRFINARIFDQLVDGMSWNTTLGSVTEFGGTAANLATHLAYTLSGGSAYLIGGSASNKLRISAGTLLQKIANKDGLDATLIPFTFDGSSTAEFTIAAGNAANPRVDLCQMKLEYITTNPAEIRDFKDATTGAITAQNLNKGKRVQCTLSVKQGTPAASPQTPDPDAGYVAVASVIVGTNYLTSTALVLGTPGAGAIACVVDQRMPLFLHTVKVPQSAAILTTAWSYNSANGAASSTNATNIIDFPIGPGNACSRLVGFYLYKNATAWANNPVFFTTQGGYSSASKAVNVLNTANTHIQIAYNNLDIGAQSAGPVVLSSSVNQIGTPMWSSGTHCARPTKGSGTVQEVLADFATGATGSSVLACYAYWAG